MDLAEMPLGGWKENRPMTEGLPTWAWRTFEHPEVNQCGSSKVIGTHEATLPSSLSPSWVSAVPPPTCLSPRVAQESLVRTGSGQ